MQQIKRSGSLIFSLLFLLSVLGALWQRTAIYDFIRLRDYTPSAAVVALADATTMNEKSRRLFYVYHPVLEDKASFNNHCTDSEKTVVLGCYIGGQGIYIYDVTDPRLNGVEEVTAAHELLHAAYDRLSTKERREVNMWADQAFSQVTDQRVKDTVEQYRQKDPSIVPNELHSILATEVRNLTPELEAYYKRYFNDRSKIVAYSEAYQQAFTEREAKLKAYDAQLENLTKQIEATQAGLDAQEASLNSQRAQLDNLRNSRNFDQYNAAVPAFNAAVRRYNDDVAFARSLIEEYNRIVGERNALAVEENQLIKAIDSRPNAIETE